MRWERDNKRIKVRNNKRHGTKDNRRQAQKKVDKLLGLN
jgi:hypothetical protein